ncbi:spinster family MFS transporter [Sphingomonas sp. M1-B02]|uniref:spinster family MFS transporter n=1 Tax=Sphingomonas sp. M1-B02 TaxID=3114300 RepID=UPI00223F21BA|nr:MFS transporter [Sphingomonas sp. S6-11]UZK67273.1 MFS transporter [Sphingomonas sp. S6-11]
MTDADSARPGVPLYAYYVVLCLMLASAFSFLDRLVLSLLIDPIRADMGLTDSQVSLLAGPAFALCYVACAFPFGRWVDTRSRRSAIVLGISLWSLATAACGLVRGYWALFTARMGVGVGEASLNPAAYSMIPDYFPPHRRGLATAIFACGASIGGGVAILAGGIVVQRAMETRPTLPGLDSIAPWQFVFVAVGLPGLLVALLFWLTVREPARRFTPLETGEAPKMCEVFGFVGANRAAIVPMFLGFGAFAVSGYAFQLWGPAYFMRLHGLTAGEVGMVFGLGYGLGGTAAILLGGVLSDALVKRGRSDAPILVSIGAAMLQAPCFVTAYLMGDTTLAILFFVGGIFAASLVGGLQATIVQSLAPNRMRGLLAALFGATVNVAGLGIAPTLTALLSDNVFGGPMGIGKALAVTTALAMAASFTLLVTGRKSARALAAQLAGQPISSPPSMTSSVPVT